MTRKWCYGAGVICVAGDARLDGTYQAMLGVERASLLLTDPPYCLLTRRRKGGDLRDKRAGVKIDRDPVVRFEDVRAYRKFTEGWLPKAAARCDGALVIWTNFLGKQPIRTVALALGYAEVGEFVWAKKTTEHEGNEQLLRVYETALVFSKAPLPPLSPADPQRVWCVAAGYDDEGEAQRHGAHPNHKPFDSGGGAAARAPGGLQRDREGMGRPRDAPLVGGLLKADCIPLWRTT